MRRELLKDKTKHLPNKNNQRRSAIPVLLKEPSPLFLLQLLFLDVHAGLPARTEHLLCGQWCREQLKTQTESGEDLTSQRRATQTGGPTSAAGTSSVPRDTGQDNVGN